VRVELDLGKFINDGFSEVIKDLGNYILIGLLVGLLSAFTLGILAGPMLAGALIVIGRKLRGEAPLNVGGVLSEGMNFFGPSFLLVFLPYLALVIVNIILGFIPILGTLLLFLINLAASGLLYPFWALSLRFVTDERLDFQSAASRTIDIIKTNPVMYWVFGLLTSIITGIGGILCGIGLIFTIPVGLVMMASFNESHFPKR